MKLSTYLIFAGLISLLGGVLAFINPVAAGLTVELLTGWAFVFSGLLAVLSIFTQPQGASKFWAAIWGALTLFAGITLLRHPLVGLVTLTTVLGLVFVVTGLLRLVLSTRLPTGQMFWALTLSGVLSVIIGGMILGNTFGFAPLALGTLLAVELLSGGISMLSYGWSHRTP